MGVIGIRALTAKQIIALIVAGASFIGTGAIIGQRASEVVIGTTIATGVGAKILQSRVPNRPDVVSIDISNIYNHETRDRVIMENNREIKCPTPQMDTQTVIELSDQMANNLPDYNNMVNLGDISRLKSDMINLNFSDQCEIPKDICVKDSTVTHPRKLSRGCKEVHFLDKFGDDKLSDIGDTGWDITSSTSGSIDNPSEGIRVKYDPNAYSIYLDNLYPFGE